MVACPFSKQAGTRLRGTYPAAGIRRIMRVQTKNVIVNNQVGLHARPATFFIQKANEFKCTIWVEKEERKINAKSLLGVLSLGVTKGTEITLIADGADEEQALLALEDLINSNFAELSV